ncbi:MAG: enoyl-ACP reductase [Bdellovibrio sp.]|nr:enoyl-ACP reductase [Bdellovibrio sp.]
MVGLLDGKKALILGVANQRSIAWGIARAFHTAGATVRISCQEERLKQKIERTEEGRIVDKIHLCDVSDENSVKSLFADIAKDWPVLDILVHSIAFAPMQALENRFSLATKDDFLSTMAISAYSLIEVSRYARALMQGQGGSIMTLSYLGGDRVLPGYGIMGPAKAALESCVRYLSYDLGPEKIRVNAISAGPLKTLASSAFGNFNEALKLIEEKTPLRQNITIDDVGGLATYLASDLSKRVTGSIHFVDSGAHIMGG